VAQRLVLSLSCKQIIRLFTAIHLDMWLLAYIHVTDSGATYIQLDTIHLTVHNSIRSYNSLDKFSSVNKQYTSTCKKSPSWATRPIGRRWSPFLQPSARHQFTLPDHRHKASALCGVAVYIPASLVLIAPTHGRMARLSWPGTCTRVTISLAPTKKWILLNYFCKNAVEDTDQAT